MKVIVHVEMDEFDVAVEIRDQPHLKEKPVGVTTASMFMLTASNYKVQ